MRNGFGMTPQVKFNRSKFDLSHSVKTTMSVGKLYPLDWQEVLPGDSFSDKTTAVARVTSSFLKPVIDNAYLDIFHFFVPYSQIFDESEKVFASASPTSYEDDELVDFPTFLGVQTVTEKTVADYLGLPNGSIPGGVSVMPFRAFANIYDKWFRNENVVDEMYIHQGNYNTDEALNNRVWSANNYTGQLPYVSKRKDYFTSALPQPQKGQPVQLALGDTAPIITSPNFTSFGENQLAFYTTASGSDINNKSWNAYFSKPTVGNPTTYILGGMPSTDAGNYDIGIYASNMVADLSKATAMNVNDLRVAFAMQKMLETDALYGGRYYNEYLLGHFGVTTPDSRLKIPEYLGGGRIPINVQQVAQTSQATEDSPLANLGGYSLSNGYSKYSKGFTEHGILMTVGCIRTMHTYQQGIDKKWTRKSRNDFYDPMFAHLGEQPIYQTELYVDDVSKGLKGDVFGYNEAWADYRVGISKITGEMRSSATNSLDIWHFGDNYSNAPVLSKDFIEETSRNIDRTLSVPSASQDNFLVDLWFDVKAIRVMPTYSVPGLIDHR